MSSCCLPEPHCHSSEGTASPAGPDLAGTDLAGRDFSAGASSECAIESVLLHGSFHMGDHHNEGYPADGEGPVHRVELSAFRMATHSVSNRQFARFVEATGYRTTAEVQGSSAVFHLLLHPESQGHVLGQAESTPWWYEVAGASWRRPWGPTGPSCMAEHADHPVVHVSFDDALAFCAWSGTRLPTEAEWEFAARGGLEGARFPWGNDLLAEDGQWRCNIWQGEFPTTNLQEDGFLGTAPVTAFAPNGFGLYAMVGNVWEWCADYFDPAYYSNSPVQDPTGPAGPMTPGGSDSATLRVMRGGSFLCHDSYCYRYRVAARSAAWSDSTSSNLGFRVAADPAAAGPAAATP